MDLVKEDFSKISEIIKQPEYNFLNTNEHLVGKTLFLVMGGSIAYGTNVHTSDIDIRGCAKSSYSDLLGLTNFEQVVDNRTDTTIYSLRKLFSLFLNCNPNCIEMLGVLPEHRLIMSPIGQMLFDNAHLFLSQKATKSFGGFANMQINRLTNFFRTENVSTEELHMNFLRSCQNVVSGFENTFAAFPQSAINIYIDETDSEDFSKSTDVFVDMNFAHYPIKDLVGIMSGLQGVIKAGNSLKQGHKEKSELKLCKHMMHLIRLYMMAIDILEKEEIVTYRSEEHDLLMDIRKGKFLDKDGKISSDFAELYQQYLSRFNYAKENTSLPLQPNFTQANDLLVELNRMSLEASI